jgi:hypothetical protein
MGVLMPEAMTVERIVQEALVAILVAGEADLRIDSRPVSVVRHVPEQAMSGRVPAIEVKRAVRQGVEPWASGYERIELSVPVNFFDGGKPNSDDWDVLAERLSLLVDRARKKLKEFPNLNLSFLHVHESFTRWQEGELESVGNNWRKLPMSLVVPVIVEEGKVWEV